MRASEGATFAERKETSPVCLGLAFVGFSFIVAIGEDLHDAARAGQACHAASLQVEIQDERADPSDITGVKYVNALPAEVAGNTVVMDIVLGKSL